MSSWITKYNNELRMCAICWISEVIQQHIAPHCKQEDMSLSIQYAWWSMSWMQIYYKGYKGSMCLWCAQWIILTLYVSVYINNQYWTIISGVLGHSPKSNFTGNAIYLCVKWIEKCNCKTIYTSIRGQWVTNVNLISGNFPVKCPVAPCSLVVVSS